MLLLLVSAGAVALAAAPAPNTGDAPDAEDPGVVVTAERPVSDLKPAPATRVTLDAGQIAATVNTVNVEDALRYAPSIMVRKRHPGDTQDPIATRTSGVGASARSLVYADDVLLSTLIGNNNGTASPHWGLVTPEEVKRIEILYGPFAAAYPGNSIGAVVNITTRMPDHLEASVDLTAGLQGFRQYGTKDSYPTGSLSLLFGDRVGPWRFWLSETHTDTTAQPLAYVTAARPAAQSTAGTPATGGFLDANRLGQPIAVIGAGGLEHQVQDTAKLKLGYDLPGGASLLYTLGYFGQQDRASAASYLHDASGAALYAGTFNLGGFAYAVPASAFDTNVYHLQQRHLMQSLTLRSRPDGVFSWEAVGSLYAFLDDEQRNPTAALPGGQAAGAPGTISRMDGSGWGTLDLRAAWRGAPRQVISLGLHADQFVFENPKYATTDWAAGAPGARTSLAKGRTETEALWGQDAIAVTSGVTATFGLRLEHWRAFDGLNVSASPALNAMQSALSADRASPKASLEWQATPVWTLAARYGSAYRFPTVTELYQAVTTGPTLSVPNPNLRPEAAQDYELSAERALGSGRVRLSLFEEHVRDALISQSAPLVAGSASLFSFVQNVPEVRSRGAELVAEGIEIARQWTVGGSVTYVDARTASDPVLPAAVGKRLPQVPRLRSSVVLTWRPTQAWSATLAGRYAGREFATIDNSDPYAHTFQGFDAFFVADARVRWQATPGWSMALGVDNLLDRKYFLFHPFPQRSVLLEVKASY